MDCLQRHRQMWGLVAFFLCIVALCDCVWESWVATHCVDILHFMRPFGWLQRARGALCFKWHIVPILTKNWEGWFECCIGVASMWSGRAKAFYDLWEQISTTNTNITKCVWCTQYSMLLIDLSPWHTSCSWISMSSNCVKLKIIKAAIKWWARHCML